MKASAEGRGPRAGVGRLQADRRKVLPSGEAMQGMSSLRLGQRQLVLDTVELISPIHNPVRPGRERCAAILRPNLVCLEGNHQMSALPRQLAEGSAYAGDGCPVVARAEPKLCAAQRFPICTGCYGLH